MFFVKSERDQMSIDDKAELFSQDYNLGPLFLQDTYLQMKPTAAEGRPCKHLDLIAKTAGSIADADLIESVMRKSQTPNFCLFKLFLPASCLVNTWNRPGCLGFNFQNGSGRIRLKTRIVAIFLACTRIFIPYLGKLEALNMIIRAIINPLAIGDHQTALKFLRFEGLTFDIIDYTLLRDDLDSLIDLSKWPGIREKSIESRFKAAFTRSYNQNSTARAYPQLVKGKKREGFSTLEDEPGRRRKVYLLKKRRKKMSLSRRTRMYLAVPD
ncbi:Replication factor C subunit 1 [Orchesella cincta]|uniref:Replication factor C subunit 1 n=1 Tax=Orchesella cincta TaxID=48709 RepID=A0A1D2M2E9_ORCCI|nr:Replication factor C subunit 1 [Orchesella cincta]